MSAKTKVKAVLRWSDTSKLDLAHIDMSSYNVAGDYKPYYVLPADAESYDAMVEQMAKASWNKLSGGESWSGRGLELQAWFLADSRIQLAALNIKRPTP